MPQFSSLPPIVSSALTKNIDLAGRKIETVNLARLNFPSGERLFPNSTVDVKKGSSLKRMDFLQKTNWLVKTDLVPWTCNTIVDIVSTEAVIPYKSQMFDEGDPHSGYTEARAKNTIRAGVALCHNINHIPWRIVLAHKREKEEAYQASPSKHEIEKPDDEPHFLCYDDALGHGYMQWGDHRKEGALIDDAWFNLPVVGTLNQLGYSQNPTIVAEYTTGASGHANFMSKLQEWGNLLIGDGTRLTVNTAVELSRKERVSDEDVIKKFDLNPETILDESKQMAKENPRKIWNAHISTRGFDTIYEANGERQTFCDIPRQQYEKVRSTLSTEEYAEWNAIPGIRRFE